MSWTNLGHIVALGNFRDWLYRYYDNLYGTSNWRIVWISENRTFSLTETLKLYEDAYFEYFSKNPNELELIASGCENVYDNSLSNVHSGTDYALQELSATHYQDIAIRRCMQRMNMHFTGKGKIQIRTNADGEKWSPGRISFHKPELFSSRILGWWNHNSIEAWYQSHRVLQVKENIQIPTNQFIVYNETPILSGFDEVETIEWPFLKINVNQKVKLLRNMYCCPVFFIAQEQSAYELYFLHHYQSEPKIVRVVSTKDISFLEEEIRKLLKKYKLISNR